MSLLHFLLTIILIIKTTTLTLSASSSSSSSHPVSANGRDFHSLSSQPASSVLDDESNPDRLHHHLSPQYTPNQRFASSHQSQTDALLAQPSSLMATLAHPNNVETAQHRSSANRPKPKRRNPSNKLNKNQRRDVMDQETSGSSTISATQADDLQPSSDGPSGSPAYSNSFAPLAGTSLQDPSNGASFAASSALANAYGMQLNQQQQQQQFQEFNNDLLLQLTRRQLQNMDQLDHQTSSQSASNQPSIQLLPIYTTEPLSNGYQTLSNENNLAAFQLLGDTLTQPKLQKRIYQQPSKGNQNSVPISSSFNNGGNSFPTSSLNSLQYQSPLLLALQPNYPMFDTLNAATLNAASSIPNGQTSPAGTNSLFEVGDRMFGKLRHWTGELFGSKSTLSRQINEVLNVVSDVAMVTLVGLPILALIGMGASSLGVPFVLNRKSEPNKSNGKSTGRSKHDQPKSLLRFTAGGFLPASESSSSTTQSSTTLPASSRLMAKRARVVTLLERAGEEFGHFRQLLEIAKRLEQSFKQYGVDQRECKQLLMCELGAEQASSASVGVGTESNLLRQGRHQRNRRSVTIQRLSRPPKRANSKHWVAEIAKLSVEQVRNASTTLPTTESSIATISDATTTIGSATERRITEPLDYEQPSMLFISNELNLKKRPAAKSDDKTDDMFMDMNSIKMEVLKGTTPIFKKTLLNQDDNLNSVSTSTLTSTTEPSSVTNSNNDLENSKTNSTTIGNNNSSNAVSSSVSSEPLRRPVIASPPRSKRPSMRRRRPVHRPVHKFTIREPMIGLRPEGGLPLGWLSYADAPNNGRFNLSRWSVLSDLLLWPESKSGWLGTFLPRLEQLLPRLEQLLRRLSTAAQRRSLNLNRNLFNKKYNKSRPRSMENLEPITKVPDSLRSDPKLNSILLQSRQRFQKHLEQLMDQIHLPANVWLLELLTDVADRVRPSQSTFHYSMVDEPTRKKRSIDSGTLRQKPTWNEMRQILTELIDQQRRLQAQERFSLSRIWLGGYLGAFEFGQKHGRAACAPRYNKCESSPTVQIPEEIKKPSNNSSSGVETNSLNDRNGKSVVQQSPTSTNSNKLSKSESRKN